jgi:hypothetical protein
MAHRDRQSLAQEFDLLIIGGGITGAHKEAIAHPVLWTGSKDAHELSRRNHGVNVAENIPTGKRFVFVCIVVGLGGVL